MERKSFALDIPITFYFDTKEPIPIDDIVRSLLGLEKLASKLPLLLGNLFDPEGEIDLQGLKVSKIESGSLLEVLVLSLLFYSQSDLEKVRNWMEVNPMGKYAKCGLAGLLVLLLASESISLYDSFVNNAKDSNETPSIQANNNIIINIGAQATGKSQEDLKKAIADSLAGDKKKVVRAALDFVSPAGGEGRGNLYAGDEKSDIFFSHEAATASLDVPDISIKDQEISLKEVDLSIRVLDRDQKEKGWKGILPNLANAEGRKLPLSFDDGVDMKKALTQEVVKADVTVTMKTDLNRGVQIPKSVFVTRIY